MSRFTFPDLARPLILVRAAVYAGVMGPTPTPVHSATAASIEDVAAVVRAAEDAEKRACRGLGLAAGRACAAR